jgi:hypothetical protein
MNTKRLPEITMVACLIVLAAWWWWPVKPVPVKQTVVPVHPLPPPEEAPLPPLTTALPVIAVEVPTPAELDPQADLSTAISDFIRLVQAREYATLLQNYLIPETYAAISEEEKSRVVMDMQNPEHQQIVQQAVWRLQAVQFMQPVYNADKTRATYMPPDGINMSFVKINGRWYPSYLPL